MVVFVVYYVLVVVNYIVGGVFTSPPLSHLVYHRYGISLPRCGMNNGSDSQEYTVHLLLDSKHNLNIAIFTSEKKHKLLVQDLRKRTRRIWKKL